MVPGSGFESLAPAIDPGMPAGLPSLENLIDIDQTQPPPEDKATIFYPVTEEGLVLENGPGGVPPHLFSRPGGMQVVGHTLALAVEAGRRRRRW